MPISWDTAADWDGAQSQSNNVVHEAVANTDHNDAGTVQRGYSYSSPPFSTNLVAWWPLHEDSGSTAHDVVGSHDGSVTGTTQGQPGILGPTAYGFAGGSSDEVVVSDGSFANVGSGDLTVAAWVRCTGTGSGNRIVDHRFVASDPRVGFRLSAGGGTLGFTFEDSSNNQIQTSGTDIADSTWHFVALAKSGTSATSYLDGAQDASASDSSFGNFDTSEEFRIGQRTDTSSNYPSAFAGDIAEVAVWTTALSQSQIQTLFDATTTAGTLTTDWRTA